MKPIAVERLFSNRDIRKLIVPLIIEQILIMAVGMADIIMISVAGESAVSGISLVDNINILIINIFAALATGGAVVAGHFLGQQNKKDASRAAWQLVLFAFISSLIVMMLYLAIHEWVLTVVFGKIEAVVYENAKNYLIITAFSIIPIALYNSAAALFRAMGNSKVTMWISFLMCMLNIAGNYVLIYVLDKGVSGAAMSTLISRTTAAAVGIGLLFIAKKDITFRGHVTWRPDLSLIKKVLYVGVPNGLENSLFQLGKILLLSLVSTLGTYAIAANAVAGTIAMFNVLPGVAVNLGLLSVVSYCMGAGKPDQARYYTKKLMFIGYVCMWVLSVVVIVGGSVILKWYSLTPETTALTMRIIRYHGLMAMFFWVPSFSLPNTLRAAGDVIYPTVIAVVSMWVFRIGAAYLLVNQFELGLMGVWIAMTVDWVFRGGCYLVRYLRGKWERVMGR